MFSSLNTPSAHLPVLLPPVLELLHPQPGETLLDVTLGLAGHAVAMAERIGPTGRIIGLDVDAANLATAEKSLSATGVPFVLYRMNFGELAARSVGREPDGINSSPWQSTDKLTRAAQEIPPVHLLLADLGVSSPQLDDARRGLSFQADGPLDMRLDDRLPTTAADLVNRLAEPKLADLIYEFGEERASRRIARLICQTRQRASIQRTGELAEVVCRALGTQVGGWHPGRIHPATRTFQALRIAVNDEMGALDRLLEALPHLLLPGGRAGIISFHSLEDGRVKRAFRAGEKAGLLRIITKKPVEADEAERRSNPRSRSAKLRVVERRESNE